MRTSRKDADLVGIGMVLVVAIAVAVGVLVFRLTAADLGERPGVSEGTGVTEPSPPESSESPPSPPEGYIRVEASSTPWSARLGGVMGLVIAVAVGAVVLALSLWTLVSFVGRLLSDAAPPA